MDKVHLSVNECESAVLGAASRIFAAQVARGEVKADNEQDMMSRAITLAIQMAQQVDDRVVARGEMH